MSPDRDHWQQRLEELAGRHAVPGASLAVWTDGRLMEAASGVLNVETQVATTTDSLFQIGSVTKPYTATLVMQLVGEGLLDLDRPLVQVLPGLRLGDAEATGRVTMRHLLAHTSGIQGDFFEDFGRGDDVVARYVEGCAELGFSHPVGATMSYCNTGYVIAGRVIEVVTGLTWDQALRERVTGPLGLVRTVTLPEEALRHRVAHGHVGDPGEDQKLAPVWGLPRSVGPAGAVCASAGEMVAFGRLHLDGGRAADGTRLLGEDLVEQMQVRQVEIPDPWTLGSHWGLGWILYDWDDRTVYGHDGATIGQAGFLRVVPDAGVVVGLLANGGQAGDLYRDLFGEVLDELCDLRMPAPLAPAEVPPTAASTEVFGTYERTGVRIEVLDRDGSLGLRLTTTGPLAELEDDPVTDLELVPVSDTVFVTRRPGQPTWTAVCLYELPDGTAYLHMGGRATPKTTGSAR